MKTRGQLQRRFYPLWFAFPALAVYFIFFIFPNLMSFVFAFTDWNSNNMKSMTFNGLHNFRFLFSDPIFGRAVLNTLTFTFVTVVFTNAFGFLMALGVNMKLKTTNFLRTVFFAPYMLSTIVTGLVFGAIYNPQHGILNAFLRFVHLDFLTREWLVNAKTALLAVCAMEIWQGMGFAMVIILAGLQTINKEYHEAAYIDGAGYFQRLRAITIPLVAQSLIVSGLLSMVSGMKVFGQIYVLTNGGPMDRTQVIATSIFKYFGSGLFGYSSAMGLVFTVIVTAASIAILSVTRKLEVEM
ncbi:carbohydrate ABC transporter permease [Cohnella cellulosilytica]|uniref:Carbohydrate ABC transporter permease n=1 Tax=Cohnella cellulosilytica TaxID=986710 RepID=A0ABW2F7J2_9BACL